MAENIKTLLKTALEDIQQGNKVLLQLLTEGKHIIYIYLEQYMSLQKNFKP